MLTQAFWTSLRILAFRAGPEDFPYDTGKRLSTACIAFGVVVNAVLAAVAGQMGVLMKMLTAPPPVWGDIVLGVATVAAMGFFTRVALRARQFESRFQQTFNALLGTSSITTLLMVLPLRQLLPFLPVAQELSKKLALNPDLMNDPVAMSALPGWTILLSLLLPALLLWQFAVTAFVYRRAANTRMGGGIFIALLCALSVLCFKDIFSLLLN